MIPRRHRLNAIGTIAASGLYKCGKDAGVVGATDPHIGGLGARLGNWRGKWFQTVFRAVDIGTEVGKYGGSFAALGSRGMLRRASFARLGSLTRTLLLIHIAGERTTRPVPASMVPVVGPVLDRPGREHASDGFKKLKGNQIEAGLAVGAFYAAFKMRIDVCGSHAIKRTILQAGGR